MSGPVTSIPPSDSPWVPLWPYAIAVHTSGKRLQADLMASGIPVYVVGGEPQVRRQDIEDFLTARQREAEARAQIQAETAVTKKPNLLGSLLVQLDRQAEELKKLQEQLRALDGSLSTRNRLQEAANEN